MDVAIIILNTIWRKVTGKGLTVRLFRYKNEPTLYLSEPQSKWILESEYPFSRVIKLYDTISINTESENRVIVFGGRIDNSLQSGTLIAQFNGSWSQLGTDLYRR